MYKNLKTFRIEKINKNPITILKDWNLKMIENAKFQLAATSSETKISWKQ